MSAHAPRRVFIVAGHCLNACGSGAEGLQQALIAPPVKSVVAFDDDSQGYVIAPPALPPGVFDRKILRSIEPQAQRLLHCCVATPPTHTHASLMQHLQQRCGRAARRALFAAIPEVDAPSPCWDAALAIAQSSRALTPRQRVQQLFASTPPLHALTMLNSTVMAYLAEALELHGPMGGYCSDANAGLDAIVDAFCHLQSDKADMALVVASSPNVTPALFLRRAHGGASGLPVPGEGAAALLLTNDAGDAGAALELLGYARASGARAGNERRVLTEAVHRALAMAAVSCDDIAYVFSPARVREYLGDFSQSLWFDTAHLAGDLGAATLLTDLAWLLGMQAHARDCAVSASPLALLLVLTDDGAVGALVIGAAADHAGREVAA